MAIIYVDSFDTYTTLAQRSWLARYENLCYIGTGRFGSGLYDDADHRRGATRLIPGAYTDLTIGFAHYKPTFGSYNGPIFYFDGRYNPSYIGSTDYVSLEMTTQGALYATRGGTIVPNAVSANNVLIPATWHYIEFRVVFHASTGSIEIRVDGQTVLSGSNLNTGITPTWFGFWGNSNWVYGSSNVDDLVLQSNNTPGFLGDVRVEAIFPSGNGATSDWTGNDGNSTDNYLLVDEASPDGATTYVASGTVDQKDLYEYGAITTTSGAIHAVQAVPVLSKSSAGVKNVVIVSRSSGGTEETSAAINPGATLYTHYPRVFETKPGGGLWTPSDVNGAQFGIKVTA